MWITGLRRRNARGGLRGEDFPSPLQFVVPPAMPVDSSPEPSTGSGWLLTGHIRSIGTQFARDGRNSDAEAATRDCYRFGNLSPVEHSRGRSLRLARENCTLEQLVLPGECFIQLRLYRSDSTLGLT